MFLIENNDQKISHPNSDEEEVYWTLFSLFWVTIFVLMYIVFYWPSVVDWSIFIAYLAHITTGNANG